MLEDHAASAQTSFAHHPQNSYDAYTVSAAPCRWRSSHGHRRHPRRSSRPWAWWTQRIWTSFRSCIRELPARSVSHSRLERACRGAPHTSACASVARYAHRSQPLPPNIQCTEMGWKQTPRRGVKLERLARGTFMAAVLTLLVAIAWNTGIGSTHGTGAQCGMSGCRWPQPACTVSSARVEPSASYTPSSYTPQRARKFTRYRAKTLYPTTKPQPHLALVGRIMRHAACTRPRSCMIYSDAKLRIVT